MKKIIVAIVVLALLLAAGFWWFSGREDVGVETDKGSNVQEEDQEQPSGEDATQNPYSAPASFQAGDLYLQAIAAKDPELCKAIVDPVLKTSCEEKTKVK